MVTANESFYQMSTPVGAKKRRISGSSVPSRLSSIPALEQSFIDDSTDFEVKNMRLWLQYVQKTGLHVENLFRGSKM